MDQVNLIKKNEIEKDSIISYMDKAMTNLEIHFSQIEVEHLIEYLLQNQQSTQQQTKELLQTIHLNKNEEDQYLQLKLDIQNNKDIQQYYFSSLYFKQHSNDMGMNILDFIFSEEKIQLILVLVQHLNLHTDFQRLNQFAQSITKYFKYKLSQLSTFPLIPFLKEAKKIPIFTLILINILINEDLFNNLLLYFNIDQYEEVTFKEHNQILRLLIKIIQEYQYSSNMKQLKILQELHLEANQFLYFQLIKKPKNIQKNIQNLIFGNNFTNVNDILEFHETMQTTILKIKIVPLYFWNMKKIKYSHYTRTIQLSKISKKKIIQKQSQNQIFWSILFECIRQAHWTNFFDYYSQSEDLGSLKDQQGRSSLAYCIQSAPKEIFPKVLQIINYQNIESLTLTNGSNIIHLILLNKIISLQDKYESLEIIKRNIGQHMFEKLLRQPIINQGITPLVLFLDNWQTKYCDHLNQFLDIIKLLSEPFQNCQFNIYFIRAMQQVINWSGKRKINLQHYCDIQNYYLNHSQVTRAISKLPDQLFEITVQHCNWINWLGLNCFGDNLYPNSNQFAINNLVRAQKWEFISQILLNIEKKIERNLPEYFKGLKFLESNPFQLMEDKKEVYFYKCKFEITQLIEELSRFYENYPFEILLGIYQETQILQQQIYKILKYLVTKEPRLLCTQISVYKKQQIMKMLYQNKLMELYYSQSQEIQQLYFEPTDALCKTLNYQQFSALEILLTKYETARQGKYLIGKERHIYCKQRLMMDKLFIDFFQQIYEQQQLQLIFDIIPRIAGLKLLMKFIGSFILRKLPDTGGVDLSTLFQILKQFPQLIVSISGAFNKALIAKNIKLLNYLTVLIQNPELKLKLNCFNISSYFRNITNYHYSICFSKEQFQQLLIDTNSILDQEDYICMAYSLCRNGMVEKFKCIINHITNKDIQCMCLREALIQFGKQEINIRFKRHYSYHQEQDKRKYLPNILRNYNILHKITLSSVMQQNLKQETSIYLDDKINETQQRFILHQGKKSPTEKYGLPKSNLQKCRVYDEKNREKERQKQNMILKEKANTYSMFSQLEFDTKNYHSLLKILIHQLLPCQQQIKEYHYLLKKMYLLPFITEDIKIMFSINNVLKFIYKSIDLLTNYLLSHKFKNTIQENEIATRGIKFIQSNFKRDLIQQIYQNPKRFRRIIGNIGKTNLRNHQQVDFAIRIAHSILHNFHQHDFDEIMGDNLFNALATFIISCQSKNQNALNTVAVILNKRHFYQIFVSKKQYIKEKEKIKIIECQFPIIVHTIQDEEYLLYLQKYKIIPFHDKYTLKAGLKIFELQDQIRNVNLYEYLCLRKCEFLIKMNYVSHQYEQGQFLYYLYISFKSGSLAIFENIIYHILKINYDQVLELCLKYPILKSIILYFNDNNAKQIIYKIFTNRNIKTIHNYLNVDFLIEIVNKKYGEVYQEILNIIKNNSINEQEYLNNLKQMFLIQIPKAEQYFIEIDQEIEEQQMNDELSMNLMEYSIFIGFPDLALSAKNVFQEETPIGSQFIKIMNKRLYSVGQQVLRTEKYHDLGIYKLFLELQAYNRIYSKGPCRVNTEEQYKADIEIITSLVLFWVLIQNEHLQTFFHQLPCFISVLKGKFDNFPFITDLETLNQNQSVYYGLYQLHISGIQFKFQNNSISVIEFLKEYDSKNNHLVFYLNTKIQQMFLELFDVDILSQRQTINDDLSFFSDLSIQKKSKIQKIINSLDEYDSAEELQQEEQEEEDNNLNPNEFFQKFDKFSKLIQQYFIINIPEIVLNQKKELFNNPSIETRQSILFFIESVLKNNKQELLLAYISLWDSQPTNDPQEFCPYTIHYNLLKIFFCISYPSYQTTQQCDKSSGFTIVNLLQDLQFQINLDGLCQTVWKTLSDLDSLQEYFNGCKGNILEDKMFINGLIEFFNRSIHHQELILNLQNNHLKYLFTSSIKQESNKIYNGFLLIKLTCNLIQQIEMFITIIDEFSDVELIIDFRITDKITKQEDYCQIISTDVFEFNDHPLYKFKISIPLIYYQQSEDKTLQIIIQQQSYDSLKSYLKEYFFKMIEINTIHQKIINQVNISTYTIHESQVQSLTINKDQIQQDQIEVILNSSKKLFNFAFSYRQLYQLNNYQFYKEIKQFLINVNEIDEEKLPIFPNSKLTILEQIDSFEFLIKDFKININVEILSYVDYLEVNRRDRQIDKLLQILNIECSKKQQSEYIEIHWPINIMPNYVVEDQYNYPQYLYYLICSSIFRYYNAELSINYYSYINTLLSPFFKYLRPNCGTNLEGIVFYALEWPLLDYIITEIKLCLQNSIWIRRQNIKSIFELRTIEEDKIIKYNSLPGIQNQLFRFGKTEYYLNKEYLFVIITINSQLAQESVYSKYNYQEMEKQQNEEIDFNFIQEILNFEELSKYKIELPVFMKQKQQKLKQNSDSDSDSDEDYFWKKIGKKKMKKQIRRLYE